jgi:hypothetical protein
MSGERFGAWVENACLSHAWNSGQQVWYRREEPLEVDGVGVPDSRVGSSCDIIFPKKG